MKPLIAVTRSNHVESIHYGYIGIVTSDNETITNFSDNSTKIFLRSSAKPFQALTAVHSGAADYFNISEQELAVMCSSHSGEEIHRETIKSILRKIDLTEDDLECGVANPYNKETNEWLIRHGKKPTKLYNCCSGKHAAMLMGCKFFGYSTKNYVRKEHLIQRLILNNIAELLECSADDITLGDDGCGVPNCMVTIQQAAYLYAQLAAGTHKKFGKSFARISAAMAKNPRMVNGEGEFCTDLIKNLKGNVIGKVGGEGVYGISIIDQKLGVCIKVLDGNERAVYPIAVHTLRQLGVMDNTTADELTEWAFPLIKDHKGKTVGYTVPVFNLRNNTVTIGSKYEFKGDCHETASCCDA